MLNHSKAASKVEAYFTGVAATYQRASVGPIWKMVRRREADRLFDLLGNVRGLDVLELGSGAGFYTRLLLENGAQHVVAVDLSQRMLDELPQGNVTPLLGDATTFDPRRTFSRLLSAGMLEFVPNPRDVLVNAARFADPGAEFVILVPRQSVLGRAYQRFHARHGLEITLFDRARLDEIADNTGWIVQETRRGGPYSFVARLVRR